MTVNIIHVCQGFLSVGPNLPGGPEYYFSDVSQVTFIVKSCLFNAQTLVFDALVVSPCFLLSFNPTFLIKGYIDLSYLCRMATKHGCGCFSHPCMVRLVR